MDTSYGINRLSLDTVLSQLPQVLYSAWDDGINITQTMLLDITPQSIVQVRIRLDAVDPIDLGLIVTRQLSATPRTHFEDRAMSFGDEFWDIGF